MSKAGLTMMTLCMAREWARYDINVNAICPGFIETELNRDWFETARGKAQIQSFPKRRLQQASDLDSTLLLLASDASRAITGSLFTVDDAQSL
jgi:NAD(P)-dependent dehydrogenase (short-subunit alcohol dehydrogenase family)